MGDLPIIGDPTNKVAIAVRRGDDEEAVARLYAAAIRHCSETAPHRLGIGDPGWTRANLALVERWGDTGRERVKERAWEIVNGREVAHA